MDGGRRPGGSSGKHTGFGLAGGRATDQRDPGAGKGAAPGSGPATQAHAAADRGQGLRQGSAAKAVEGRAARWTKTAVLSQAVESRAHLCMAGELPASWGTLGSPDSRLPGVFPSGVPDDYAEANIKLLQVYPE